MVIPLNKRRKDGLLSTDLIVALSIIALALIPLSYSWLKDQQICRAYYHRALANQLVDGEMEILVAGEWKSIPEGTAQVQISGRAATNLPPGAFTLHRSGNELRLNWKSTDGKLLVERKAMVQ